MRCKNCGFENEPERYICENCGSPLYDEDEDVTAAQDDYADDYPNDEPDDTDLDKQNKRNIIIIAVLAVVLVAILTGIIIGIASANKTPDEPSTSDVSSTTPTINEPSSSTTAPTTTEPTTEPTTESTTKPTTESTTEEPAVTEYLVSVDIDGNGTVTGDGTYEVGKKATLVATPDADSQFVGWYDNATGQLVASGNKYTVTVQKDLSLTAKFQLIDQPEEPEPEEAVDGQG